MLRNRVVADAAGMALARRFAEAEYWRPEYSGLFSEEFTLDLPFAPPGMYQTMTHQETEYYFRWMCHTVSNWRYQGDAKVFATDQEGLYWVFRCGQGDVAWAKTKGVFKSKMAALIRIRDGKIVYAKEHMDTAAYYEAIQVELPRFRYDAPDPAGIKPRDPAPVIQHTPESLERQIEATLNFFINPSYWEPEINCVLADDFIHELVFAPKDMPRVYKGTEYDSINAWLAEHMGDGRVFDCKFYNTDDPHVFIAEFNCYFDVTWGGAVEGGHYSNREISYIEINDAGLCTRLDEYFNTTSKFNSIGVSIPSFPQLY